MDNDSNVANDNQLIADAQRDPAAFVRLYRRHYDAVFRYCVHRLFERHTAEDITSQVFLKVIENFDHFKGNQQQFRNWLYRIATNAVNNHSRTTGRRKTLLKVICQPANRPDTDYKDTSTEKLALLRQAMVMAQLSSSLKVTGAILSRDATFSFYRMNNHSSYCF